MASVAAAINRASSSKVDADLWWSPHGALLARLEAIDSGGSDNVEEDGRELARSLSEHHTWLLHGLACFKPPSSRSRDAIGAARLEVGVGAAGAAPGAPQVTIPVTGRLREAAVTASAVIAFFLADRVGGGERALVGEAEGEGAGKGAGGGEEKKGVEEKEEQRRLVQEVVALYQEERQSLLKCLRLLLAMQADSSSPYAAAIEGEVSALLNEGLLSNVMAQLRLLPRSEPPKALELFFGFTPSPPPLSSSPYSTPPSSSSSSPSSPSVSLASLAISAAAESLLSTALHRAVLLLIAAVDVEGVVVALAQGMHFSASQHPLSSTSSLTEVDQRLSAWLSCLLSAAAAAAKGAGGRGQSEELDGGVGGMAEEDLEEVYGGGGGGRLIGLDAVVPLVGTRGAAGSDVSPVLLAWGLLRMLLQWLPDSSHLPVSYHQLSSAIIGPVCALCCSHMLVSPMLLAWGLLRMLLQWLPDSSHLPAPSLNPGVCVQAAYAAGALDWILSSLLSSSLPSHPSNDPVMQGVVKRCVKGLCTAYLTAFDISNQPPPDATSPPAPSPSCASSPPSPMAPGPPAARELLPLFLLSSPPSPTPPDLLAARACVMLVAFHPQSSALLLSALSTLSALPPGPFSAQHHGGGPLPPPSETRPLLTFLSLLSPLPLLLSFEFLESTMGAALFLPLPPACASLSALSAPQPLLLPRCGGLLVLTGARGEVVEGGGRDGTALVHFEVPLSALLILLFRLVHRAQQDQDASPAAATWQSAIGGADVSTSAAGLGGEEEAAEELSVGLSLLSNLLSANQACVVGGGAPASPLVARFPSQSMFSNLASLPLPSPSPSHRSHSSHLCPLPRMHLPLDTTALITATLDGLLSSPALLLRRLKESCWPNSLPPPSLPLLHVNPRLDPTALITAILDGLLSSPALSNPSSPFSSSSSSPSSSSSTSHAPSAAVALASAACCLRILAAFALLHPERVAAALSSSVFSPSALSSDLQLQSGPATSPLHLLCFQIEQPLGSFPFTLA
ncbi:unnamed protein product, partial [Closterium sp. Naga37s-1]